MVCISQARRPSSGRRSRRVVRGSAPSCGGVAALAADGRGAASSTACATREVQRRPHQPGRERHGPPSGAVVHPPRPDPVQRQGVSSPLRRRHAPRRKRTRLAAAPGTPRRCPPPARPGHAPAGPSPRGPRPHRPPPPRPPGLRRGWGGRRGRDGAARDGRPSAQRAPRRGPAASWPITPAARLQAHGAADLWRGGWLRGPWVWLPAPRVHPHARRRRARPRAPRAWSDRPV